MLELTEHHHRLLLDVARWSIRAALGMGRARDMAGMPERNDPAVNQPAGCFVTLHELRTRALRGCIGRMEATSPLIRTVHEMAASVLDDPRFVNRRVTPEDLPKLEIEISVVSPMRPAAGVLRFDPPSDGLYLEIEGRTGCFLPQVARETGWSREQLLARLCAEKMGLDRDAWRWPGARLRLFSVVIIGPEAFERRDDPRG